eukprot:2257156-Amphidinium_carterae.1
MGEVWSRVVTENLKKKTCSTDSLNAANTDSINAVNLGYSSVFSDILQTERTVSMTHRVELSASASTATWVPTTVVPVPAADSEPGANGLNATQPRAVSLKGM